MTLGEREDDAWFVRRRVEDQLRAEPTLRERRSGADTVVAAGRPAGGIALRRGAATFPWEAG